MKDDIDIKDDIKAATVIAVLTAITFNLTMVALRLAWAWSAAAILGAPTLSHVQSLIIVTAFVVGYLMATIVLPSNRYRSYISISATAFIVTSWLMCLIAH